MKMKSTSNYVIVTPARNEGATIGETIRSVISQSVRPREWIIVSDGSIDSTNEQVELASQEHPWIRLLRMGVSCKHNFGRIAYLINTGLNQISTHNYEWISILDADIRLPVNYYETVGNRIDINTSLGITGCVVTDLGTTQKIPRNIHEIPGAVLCITKKCFESIGGFLSIPEGGWDGVACAMARINGYDTQLLTGLNADHLKKRNISQGNYWKRKWQMGQRDYAAGYHPLFELLKCIIRYRENPIILSSLAWWLGYCSAWKSNQPRIISNHIVNHIRKEQLLRIKNQIWI